jgi:hypothetical protein
LTINKALPDQQRPQARTRRRLPYAKRISASMGYVLHAWIMNCQNKEKCFLRNIFSTIIVNDLPLNKNL